ncbi:hypothetical protein ACF05W_28195 [Streptomyces lydicus]|uniref:hypothetical protein n=1 Tax=Streptomyces lydicus TaxID=47763 RepID=UPI0036F87E02
MTKLLSRQKCEVEVEFYSFALQEADDSLVPAPFPENSEANTFLSVHERRVDIKSGGHTHTALLTVEVWSAAPDREVKGDWKAEAEGEIACPTGELAVCEMRGNPETYIDLGKPQTLWRIRVHCSGREAAYRLAQIDVPSGIERYLAQFWPAR